MRKSFKSVISIFDESDWVQFNARYAGLFERCKVDLCEVWKDASGVIHRDNGPAVIARNSKDPSFLAWMYYKDGALHRERGPAVVIRDDLNHDTISLERQWFDRGISHRAGGPSFQQMKLTSDGPIYLDEDWYYRGDLHRQGGPAMIAYAPDGQTIIEEQWKIRDQFHRVDGPAHIERHAKSGRTKKSDYYVCGNKISDVAWFKEFFPN